MDYSFLLKILVMVAILMVTILGDSSILSSVLSLVGLEGLVSTTTSTTSTSTSTTSTTTTTTTTAPTTSTTSGSTTSTDLTSSTTSGSTTSTDSTSSTTSGSTTSTTSAPVNCYALYVRLETLNELVVSTDGSIQRLTANLAAVNSELSDAQTKRGQETNVDVLAAWDEWITFHQRQVTYFQDKLNHVITINANYTAEKAQVEAEMTASCGGFENPPVFNLDGFFLSLDQRFVMLNRTINVIAQIVGQVVPVGAEITGFSVKYGAYASNFLDPLAPRYAILKTDIDNAFGVYKTQIESHITLFNTLNQMFSDLTQQVIAGGSTTSTTAAPVNCYALYVRLETLNELVVSIDGARQRFTANLAAANGELSDAQTKRGQETNADVLADWDEWIAFNQRQVTYFQDKLDHANTIHANYTAEKAQVEAEMTASCGGFENPPVFNLDGFFLSLDQRFVMLNRTFNIISQIVGQVAPVGAEITGFSVKYGGLAIIPFNSLAPRYAILKADVDVAFDVYKTQMESHITLFNTLNQMISDLTQQAAEYLSPF